MHWFKRDRWKAVIAVAGILLLVLMVWVPVSAAGTYERALGLATLATGTAQVTPTEDATVTALNKEKLEQEVQQLKNQNELDLFGWLRTNAAILLSTLVVVIGGLIGLFRWFGDRRSEREKRAEERFQAAVTGLGDEKEGAKIGAAILLRTFLRPGYEQFYTQTFDLAVANLCPTISPNPPEDPEVPLPLTTLRQALIMVFKEAFPCARSQNKGSPQSLDANYIQLDNAYLSHADLKQVWMPHASLRKVVLVEANLSGANLYKANLYKANLKRANLIQADLIQADFIQADLSGAKLNRAKLNNANLERTDLSETDLEDALSLKDTNLRGVKGLTKEQLEACKAKGAIIDEVPTTHSSQSTVSPSPSTQSNDIQASSTPSAQGSIQHPDTGGSSATASQQDTKP
jgi:uncharacterized protein YjbI with pentapeptide repeats